MHQIFEERYIYDLIILNSPYAYFLVIMIIKLCKTGHIPRKQKLKIKKSLIIKISIILIIIAIKLITFILGLTTNLLWISDRENLSYVYIFHIFILVFQIILIIKEELQKLPTVWYTHALFWIISALEEFFLFINSIFLIEVLKKIFIV